MAGTPTVGADLTGTPASGADLTGTPSVGADLTSTPSTGTGSTDLTVTPSANTTTTAVIPVTGGPATVNVSNDPTLGKILVDGNGMTLYTYSKDTSGLSNCTGDCLQNWPPLLTNGTPVAGAGVDASLLGTINAPSGAASGSTGSLMVTYKGMPLYTYIQDTKPGDVNGKNVGGVWAVAVP